MIIINDFKVVCIKDFNTYNKTPSTIGITYTVNSIRDRDRGKYYHLYEIGYWINNTFFITLEQHRDNQLNKIL